MLCTNVDEAAAAARVGADFLVMCHALGSDEHAGLCGLVPVPVFARGIELEEAWTSGATGFNNLTIPLSAND
jgi:hypothetical protein